MSAATDQTTATPYPEQPELIGEPAAVAQAPEIDPRPLPAAWLRVWRSVGLDVSVLEATPERGPGAEVEIPTPEKNPHPQPRTP